MTPKVSVLVPCYNLGAFLDEAIDSVLAQTFQDFEIVIVDDGSTDPATRALLADYRKPNTRVIRIERAGVSVARNTAIANSSGPSYGLDRQFRRGPELNRFCGETSIPRATRRHLLGWRRWIARLAGKS